MRTSLIQRWRGLYQGRPSAITEFVGFSEKILVATMKADDHFLTSLLLKPPMRAELALWLPYALTSDFSTTAACGNGL